MHGEGLFSWPNGKIFDGQFEYGKYHGKAKFTEANGKENICFFEKG